MNDKVNVSSPYEVKEIIFQRRYPGYIYRREIIDDSDSWISPNPQSR